MSNQIDKLCHSSNPFWEEDLVEEDEKIFTIQKVKFRSDRQIDDMVVANNHVYMVLNGRSLYYRNLSKNDQIEEYLVPSAMVAKSCYCSTDGVHVALIVYDDQSKQRRRVCYSQPHNHFGPHITEMPMIALPTCVGFVTCKENVGCVIGTQYGTIYGFKCLCSKRPKFVAKELYRAQDIASDDCSGFLDIQTFNLNGAVCILALTSRRLYRFVLSSTMIDADFELSKLFDRYKTEVISNFKEFPESFLNGRINVLQSHGDTRLVWMAGFGLYAASISLDEEGDDIRMLNGKIVKYPEDCKPESLVKCALTQYHCVVLNSEGTVFIIDLIAQKCIQRYYIDEPHPRGLVKDVIKGVLWAHSQTSVYRFKIIDECKYVYRELLDQNLFDEAINACEDNEERLNYCLKRKADHLFKDGRIEESVKLYAQCYKLTNIGEIYRKLLSLKSLKFLNLFLIEKMKTSVEVADVLMVHSVKSMVAEIVDEVQADRTTDLLKDLRRFLIYDEHHKEIKKRHYSSILEILIRNDLDEVAIEYSKANGDFDSAINLLICKSDLQSATQILCDQADSRLHYKYACTLLPHDYESILTSWRDMGPFFDIRQVLPRLIVLTLRQKHSNAHIINALIDYLEFCIYELNEPLEDVHNLLLALYVKHRPNRIEAYLQKFKTSFCNRLLLIRLLSDHNLHNELCKVYMDLGMMKKAIVTMHQFDATKALNMLISRSEDLPAELWASVLEKMIKDDMIDLLNKRLTAECNETDGTNMMASMNVDSIKSVLIMISNNFPNLKLEHFIVSLMKFGLSKCNEMIKIENAKLEEAKDRLRNIDSLSENRSGIRLAAEFSIGDQMRCSKCHEQVDRGTILFPLCRHLYHESCLARNDQCLICGLDLLNENFRKQIESVKKSTRFQ